MFTRDNPYRHPPMRNIQLNYEKMRQTVLKMGYDKVFIVENDMLIPDNALKTLLSVDAPIVGGLYSLRHGSHVPNVMKTPGEPYRWEELRGKTEIECQGVCMGCVVVDRSALDFCFEIPEAKGATDMMWMRHNVGKHRTVARLDVKCGHVEPNGNVLHPDTFIGATQ